MKHSSFLREQYLLKMQYICHFANSVKDYYIEY